MQRYPLQCPHHTLPYLILKHSEVFCNRKKQSVTNWGKRTYWHTNLHLFFFCIWFVFISVFIVSELSSSGESVALTKPQDDSWEKKKEKRKRERKPLEKHLIHWASSAFVPQSDTVLMLKNPCAAARDAETLPTFQFPSFSCSLSSPASPTPPTPAAPSLTAKQAVSHWSCKLCLRHVYAPFLPKHLLSLTNYSRINYKPFREWFSPITGWEGNTHTHTLKDLGTD